MAPLAFVNPWILAGLAFLPALWFLLRVVPPAPRRIVFPAARFLEGLVADDQTPSRTPWWILLMRVLASALIIVALARPVLHPAAALGGHGPIRIVIDNGWASASNWVQTMQAASDILDRAARDGRSLYVTTTAPEPGTDKPLAQGPMARGQAEGVLRGLSPRPWPADYTAAAALLRANAPGESVESFFISHGLKDRGDAAGLLSLLQNQGALTVYLPAPERWPLLLRPAHGGGDAPPGGADAYIDSPQGARNGMPVAVQAQDPDGRVLDIREFRLKTDDLPQAIRFDMPDTLRARAVRFALSGRAGAGGVILAGDRSGRKAVGLVSASREGQQAPLIEAGYYISRALSPYADLMTGSVEDLLGKKPSVMILPDIGALPAAELNALEDWMKKGGLLLRFAGPNMSQGEDFLTPVPLRRGGRALNGALTWEKPLHIAPFPETGPFAGLEIPRDLTVRQQILAEPVDGMDRKTWASLEDGTPLVTAAPLERGMLVMIHTTATPAWSDLALSGLFVQMLRRTVAAAGTSFQTSARAGGMLQPVIVLDGFGRETPPEPYAGPIDGGERATPVIDSRHPPGIYGRPGTGRALNLGETLPALERFGPAPDAARVLTLGQAQERDLMPVLLTIALCLFFIDWAAMIALQAGWRMNLMKAGRAAAILLALAAFAAPRPAAAQSADDIKRAGAIYLAYVRSGDPGTDETAREGLESLVRVLNERTSVEPAGVVALDPEKDELAFFPLLYWPVAGTSSGISPAAQRRVQDYLDHGGTILFDTDGQASPAALQAIAGSLNVPPLVEMPKDHVLTRSFYLLRDMPGRYEGVQIWVEDQSASGRDGVSSVIVGSGGWAYAWKAHADPGLTLPGGNRQEEMAMRFGVNLVMYALTGNYKADQVHLPQIMERLSR